jgi:large subunit ribosomal protein L15
MNLSNLHPAKNSRKNRKRVGRGPGSGYGKTSGRGSKGQKSISGYSHKRGFEGGQMPIHRRLPKRGFTNIYREEYCEVNLDRLERINKAEIQPADMIAAGLVKKKTDCIKILGRGELSSAKTIHAHRFSRAAAEKIEKAGGKTIQLGRP